MIEVEEVELKPKRVYSETDPVRPTIMQWRDARMIRTHSLGSCIQEVLQAVAVEDSQDVVNINIIGPPSSGKSTLADTIGHLIHKRAKIPFSIRKFKRQDMLNFKETLATLSPANYVLIFDDLSFLGAEASSKQIEIVKQAVTEIRHLPGGQDVKIVIVKNFHYTLGLPKYLRQSDFNFFTDVGSSEIENMERIVGSINMGKVHFFKKIKNKIKIAPEGHKIFTFQLGTKGKFDYVYRKPFIPLLYWNGDTLRHVVSPTREWIDPICSICTEFGSKEKFENAVDIKKFIDEGGKSYGESTFKAAVLNKLRENGVNAHRPQVVSAERFLSKCLEKKLISLDDMANYYGLKPTNTKMRKNVDAILEKATLPEKQVDLIEKVEG